VGASGISLYADDFAKDLKSAVAAVARLPFGPDALLDHLHAVERSAADDPTDPDHTVFWLVVADQFAARGIDCLLAREKALALIDEGTDLATMGARGMDAKSIGKRRAILAALRERIVAPRAPAKRAVLKAPQTLLLEVGETVVYPVSKGEPINPYTTGKEWAWVKAWQQDGWGAFVVAECGLAFDYFAWYRPLVIGETLATEPAMAHLLSPHMWLLGNPGTLTARHLLNMQLKTVGHVAIDAAKLEHAFPQRVSPVNSAASDISIANALTVRGLGPHEAHRIKHGYPPTPRINALAEIAQATQ
jgi:hypothetical protein